MCFIFGGFASVVSLISLDFYQNHLVGLNLKRSLIEKKAYHIFAMKIKVLCLLLYF